jgi:hypothetical protein
MRIKIWEGTLNLFTIGYPPYQAKFKCNVNFLILHRLTLLRDTLTFH